MRPSPSPPYFPEPITVPGSVASVKYGERLLFVRRVLYGHLVTVAMIGVSSFWPDWPLTLKATGLLLFLLLVCSSIVRRAMGSGTTEAILSWALTLPAIPCVGQIVRGVSADLPVWTLGIAPLAILSYLLLCGRDFSFAGMGVLSGIATLAAAFSVAGFGAAPWSEIPTALGLAFGYLLYLPYDLSMVMKRRRPEEYYSSVADLFRDLLNWISYIVRVVLHWRRYRF